MFVGQKPDPQSAHDRAEVMAAGAAHGDRPDDHQLVEILGIGELGYRRLRNITALEDLLQIHLGDAPRRVARVVVVPDVDHKAFENAFELARYLIEKLVQFARRDEFRDVVVGVIAPPGGFHPSANAGRDRKRRIIACQIGGLGHGTRTRLLARCLCLSGIRVSHSRLAASNPDSCEGLSLQTKAAWTWINGAQTSRRCARARSAAKARPMATSPSRRRRRRSSGISVRCAANPEKGRRRVCHAEVARKPCR